MSDLTRRLDELAALPKGWCNGEGERIQPDAIAWVRERMPAVLSATGLAAFWLFPTVEGGVQIEWEIGPWAAEVEIRSGLIEALAFRAPSFDRSATMKMSESPALLIAFLSGLQKDGRNGDDDASS